MNDIVLLIAAVIGFAAVFAAFIYGLSWFAKRASGYSRIVNAYPSTTRLERNDFEMIYFMNLGHVQIRNNFKAAFTEEGIILRPVKFWPRIFESLDLPWEAFGSDDRGLFIRIDNERIPVKFNTDLDTRILHKITGEQGEGGNSE